MKKKSLISERSGSERITLSDDDLDHGIQTEKNEKTPTFFPCPTPTPSKNLFPQPASVTPDWNVAPTFDRHGTSSRWPGSSPNTTSPSLSARERWKEEKRGSISIEIPCDSAGGQATTPKSSDSGRSATSSGSTSSRRKRPPSLESIAKTPQFSNGTANVSQIAKYLATFVPNLVLRHHLANPAPCVEPVCENLDSACILFCDIGGFSALTNQHKMIDGGFEKVASLISQYFTSLTRLILAHDGGECFSKYCL